MRQSQPTLISIIGARPQFIKLAAIAPELQPAFRHLIIHTGQHYDHMMSDVFFRDLDIPKPNYHLGINSGTHGAQTGSMLIKIEKILERVLPDAVVVYGDTNSTLAGALAAVKLRIPLLHIEAGMRSYNRAMPEEHNRVLTDHVSDMLFCPSSISAQNLEQEHVHGKIFVVGDIMLDLFQRALPRAQQGAKIREALKLTPGGYYLLTVHRAGNTDDPEILRSLMRTMARADLPTIFPVHPRTKKMLRKLGLLKTPSNSKIRMIEPVGYYEMLTLEQSARAILTDSGGVQKEAYFFGVPCITLREETEWTETLGDGWNIVVGHSPKKILLALKHPRPKGKPKPHYGRGKAGETIVRHISRAFHKRLKP